jgi:hypothetical protein
VPPAGVTSQSQSLTEFLATLKVGEYRAVNVDADQRGLEGTFLIAELLSGATEAEDNYEYCSSVYYQINITCHCINKAAPLHICRVVLLLLTLRRGATGLGELQWTRGQNKYAVTIPAHTQRALHRAHSP